MELRAAEMLAKALMLQHGLVDWRFGFDRARRRFGTCSTALKRITLSAHLTHLNSEDEVRDTILHEIAHALAPDDGHGEAWKSACRRIGARPERTFKDGPVRMPSTGLRIGCPQCGWWVNRHRVTWRVQVCRKCAQQVEWEEAATGKRYLIRSVPGGYRADPVEATPAKP